MRALEKAPPYELTAEAAEKSIQYGLKKEVKDILKKIEDEYLYWDKVKYISLPARFNHKDLWIVTKFRRSLKSHSFSIGNHGFSFSETMRSSKMLHEFDMRFGGSFFSNSGFDDTEKRRHLVSSIMEEAISSSQIEGAVITRVAAKEMLRQQRPARNKSEQMIINNYKTIQRIGEIKDRPLTQNLLLEIQELITKETLDNVTDEGRIRTSDEVMVIDSTDNEVVYHPPKANELEGMIADLCRFFNEDPPAYFIHPIVKASIIHFLIGYIHPFGDGNGRTARALFYWYLLKHGYWLTEYLSISSVILKTRTQYSKAYLYSESDNNDLTYFVLYKLKVLQNAYEKLQEYLQRKTEEKRRASQLLIAGDINDRQAKIIQWLMEDFAKIITVKEIETSFSVSNQTARNDLQQLEEHGWLKSSFINKKKQVFGRSDNFDKKVKQVLPRKK